MSLFIVLSKVLPQLFLPPGSSMIFLMVAVVLLGRRRYRGALLLCLLSLGTCLLPALPVVGDALLGALEQRYPEVAAADSPSADVIVVLGGGTSGRAPHRPEVDLGASGMRLLHAYRLYKDGKAPLLLLSGGSVYQSGDSEAEQMKQILGEWGVPAAAMVLETHSRNTHENAVDSLALCRQRGWSRVLLVTSAFHMPRALAIFHREAQRTTGDRAARSAAVIDGPLRVLPAATGALIAGGPRLSWVASFIPDAGALANSVVALHEHLGIFVYGLRGWL